MSANGMVAVRSSHSVEETVASLQRIFAAKGLIPFALIDHSGEAAKVGMKMLPTKLLIFGGPKAGTPIMLAREDSRHLGTGCPSIGVRTAWTMKWKR
jgi:uncharacterized protein (DUF302 family)